MLTCTTGIEISLLTSNFSYIKVLIKPYTRTALKWPDLLKEHLAIQFQITNLARRHLETKLWTFAVIKMGISPQPSIISGWCSFNNALNKDAL